MAAAAASRMSSWQAPNAKLPYAAVDPGVNLVTAEDHKTAVDLTLVTTTPGGARHTRTETITRKDGAPVVGGYGTASLLFMRAKAAASKAEADSAEKPSP